MRITLSDIRIDIKRIRNENYMLRPVISKLSSIEKNLSLLKWKMEDEIDEACNTKERITDISEAVLEICDEIERVYDITMECIEQYMAAEDRLNEKADNLML